ncbi:SdpI family protein [Deminuibacter soli]|nr:SdpI family protein [Deminuibacter soli]
MRTFSKTDLLALVLLAVPLVYLAAVYNTLPARVPMHFNIQGTPDRYGSKTELLIVLCILTGVAAGVYALCRWLPSIDPKKTAKYSADVARKIALAVLLLVVAVSVMVIYSAQHGSSGNITRLLPFLLGGLFVFLGNLMNSLKPNYFIGIRTPWTLESEPTWRKTHRFGAVVFVIGGILLIVCGLVLPPAAATICIVCISVAVSVLTIGYSYFYYRSLQKQQP